MGGRRRLLYFSHRSSRAQKPVGRSRVKSCCCCCLRRVGDLFSSRYPGYFRELRQISRVKSSGICWMLLLEEASWSCYYRIPFSPLDIAHHYHPPPPPPPPPPPQNKARPFIAWAHSHTLRCVRFTPGGNGIIVGAANSSSAAPSPRNQTQVPRNQAQVSRNQNQVSRDQNQVCAREGGDACSK